MTEDDLARGYFTADGKFHLPDDEEVIFYGLHQLHPEAVPSKNQPPIIVSSLTDQQIAGIMQIPHYSAHQAEISWVNYARDVANAAAQHAILTSPEIVNSKLARQCIDELLVSFDSFEEIGNLHGKTMLATLIYLILAVAKKSYIEITPAQHADLTKLLAGMPSSVIWQTYLSVCDDLAETHSTENCQISPL